MVKVNNLDMKIKSVLILAAVVLLGCVHTPTPPVAIPTPPAKVESVLPSITKISKEVQDGVNTNENVSGKLQEQTTTLKDQDSDIDQSLEIAKAIDLKIALKQLVLGEDADNLVKELQKVKTRNLFLENENSDLVKMKDEQDKNLKIMGDSLADAQEKVINKENEADQLRTQDDFLSKNLNTKNKEVQEMDKSLTKEKEIAATALVYKHAIWWAVGIFLLWTVVKNVLMIYFPATKFRI